MFLLGICQERSIRPAHFQPETKNRISCDIGQSGTAVISLFRQRLCPQRGPGAHDYASILIHPEGSLSSLQLIGDISLERCSQNCNRSALKPLLPGIGTERIVGGRVAGRDAGRILLQQYGILILPYAHRSCRVFPFRFVHRAPSLKDGWIHLRLRRLKPLRYDLLPGLISYEPAYADNRLFLKMDMLQICRIPVQLGPVCDADRKKGVPDRHLQIGVGRCLIQLHIFRAGRLKGETAHDFSLSRIRAFQACAAYNMIFRGFLFRSGLFLLLIHAILSSRFLRDLVNRCLKCQIYLVSAVIYSAAFRKNGSCVQNPHQIMMRPLRLFRFRGGLTLGRRLCLGSRFTLRDSLRLGGRLIPGASLRLGGRITPGGGLIPRGMLCSGCVFFFRRVLPRCVRPAGWQSFPRQVVTFRRCTLHRCSFRLCLHTGSFYSALRQQYRHCHGKHPCGYACSQSDSRLLHAL